MHCQGQFVKTIYSCFNNLSKDVNQSKVFTLAHISYGQYAFHVVQLKLLLTAWCWNSSYAVCWSTECCCIFCTYSLLTTRNTCICITFSRQGICIFIVFSPVFIFLTLLIFLTGCYCKFHYIVIFLFVCLAYFVLCSSRMSKQVQHWQQNIGHLAPCSNNFIANVYLKAMRGYTWFLTARDMFGENTLSCSGCATIGFSVYQCCITT